MSSRAVSTALVLLLAAGCTPPPPTAASRANAAALASCRSSTDASFNQQNRYLLSEQDTTDSPFSTSGVSGITTRGLTQRYDYGTQLASCLSASANPTAAGASATSIQPPAVSGTQVAPY
jgi:hypothetical protein